MASGKRTIQVFPQEAYSFVIDVCAAYRGIFTLHEYFSKWSGITGYGAELPDGRCLIQNRGEYSFDGIGRNEIGLRDENYRLIHNFGSSITNEQIEDLIAPFLHFAPSATS